MRMNEDDSILCWCIFQFRGRQASFCDVVKVVGTAPPKLLESEKTPPKPIFI